MTREEFKAKVKGVVDAQTFMPLDDFLDDVYEQIVKSLVTPTRKVGKWIGHREHCESLGVMPSGLGAYEWCSNCDCGIDVREWHRNNYNFCPNCGSEMESDG